MPFSRVSSLRLCALLVIILLGFASALIAWRVEQVLLQFSQERGLRVAQQVRDHVEEGYRLGMGLEDQRGLLALLERLRAEDRTLQAIGLRDAQGEPVAETGVVDNFAMIQPVWTHQLIQRSATVITRGVARHAVVGISALDSAGRVVATIWLVYERDVLREAGWNLLRGLFPTGLVCAVLCSIGLSFLHRRWQRLAGTPQWAYTAMALGLVMVMLAALAWQAQAIAKPLLLSQIELNAQAVLRSVQAPIERALQLKITPDQLVGVEALLAEELQPADELAFMTYRGPDGRTLAFRTRDATSRVESAIELRRPLSDASGQPAGELVAGIAPNFIDRCLVGIGVDLLLALVVGVVLVRELLGSMLARSSPYAQGVNHGVAGEWGRLRFIVFFTALSEELLRPFFSVFASEAVPLPWSLSPTMLAGLPVTAFMLTLAMAQPLGPWITRRIEPRRSMFFVLLGGFVLMALTATTRDGLTLVLLRAGSGVAHGLVLILAQTTIVRTTTVNQRARGLVEISAAIVAAGVCGPMIGGLLVERFGASSALAACAASLAIAGVSSLRIAALTEQNHALAAGLGGWRGLTTAMGNRRVVVVTWLAAVPARLVAAALLVVVTPLYLLEQGEPPSAAGRALLLYFLAFMLTAPVVARWSDLLGRRKPWLIAGSALSAFACAALPLLGGFVGAALCCALLGIAQALMSSPQLAWVTEAFEHGGYSAAHGASSVQALAAFRFIERFGSIVAPFVVALAVAQFGLTGAVGAIGGLLAACTVLLVFILASYSESTPRAVL